MFSMNISQVKVGVHVVLKTHGFLDQSFICRLLVEKLEVGFWFHIRTYSHLSEIKTTGLLSLLSGTDLSGQIDKMVIREYGLWRKHRSSSSIVTYGSEVSRPILEWQIILQTGPT